MACYYLQNGNIETLSQEDLQEAVKSGAAITAPDFTTLKNLLLTKENYQRSNLTFYNSDFTENLKDKFNKLNAVYRESSKKRGSVSITSIAQNISPEIKTEQNKALDIIIAFQKSTDKRKGFGELFHDFVEADTVEKEDKIIDEIYNFIESFRNNSNYRKIIEEQTRTSSTYLQFFLFLNNINKERLGSSLKGVKEEVKKRYSQYQVLPPEQDIAVKTPSGIYVRGRIDSLYYKQNPSDPEDGEIIIVDYKTCVNNKPSTPKSDIQHYMQLQTERAILIQAGVAKRDKIKIENVKFTFSSDGVTLASNSVTGPFQNTESILGLKDLNRANNMLAGFFPTIFSLPTNADIEKMQINVAKKFKKLFDTPTIQKLEETAIKEKLKNAVEKQQNFFLFQYNQYCSVKYGEEVNDQKTYNITYKDDDGNFVTDENISLEQIVLNEKKEHAKGLKGSTSIIIDKIKKKDIDGLKSLFKNSQEASERFYENIKKYLNSNWVVCEAPSLTSMGFILFKHIDGTYDLVSFADLNSRFDYIIENDDNLISDLVEKKYKGIPEKSIENILQMKALIALSEFSKELSENIVIGDIKVISLINGRCTRKLTEPFLTALKVLENNNIEEFQDIYTKLRNKVSFLSQEDQLIIELQDAVSSEFSLAEFTKELSSDFNSLSISNKIRRLRALQRKIIVTYGKEVLRDYNYNNPNPEVFDPQQIIIDSVPGKILATTSALILKMSGFQTTDPEIITKHGITISDTITELFNTLIKGQAKEHTSSGMAITGVVGGVDMANAYSNPSEYVDFANKRILACLQQIKQLFTVSIDESNDAAIEFINSEIKAGIISGHLINATIGGHTKAYLRLLEIGENKTQIPIFRNPYTDNTLSEAEKQYLKQLLWHINRLRYKGSFLSQEMRQKSFKEIQASPELEGKFKQLLKDDPTTLYMPLIPSSKIRGKALLIADYFKGKRTSEDIWKQLKKGLSRISNPNDLSTEQSSAQKSNIDKLCTFNKYRESEESRYDIMKDRVLSDFELNFNFLENDMELAYIKEKYEQQLMPLLRDLIISIRCIETATGVPMKTQINAIMDRVKIMIYGDNLIETEDKEASGAQAIVKKVFSVFKLGLRPLLGAKEMLTGNLKNLATVVSKTFLTPTGKTLQASTLTKAAAVVYPAGIVSGKLGAAVGANEMGEKNKIEKINYFYGINDSDLNSLSDVNSADNYGIASTGSRNLYYFSTRPDWYLRNNLFIGSMMEDGCFEAHYLDENGNVKYDISKDTRFSLFWKERFSKNLSKEALEQKSLYVAMMQEFIINNPELDLHYGEINDENGNPIYSELPSAYTPLQIASIKEQIGMLFGMYDHEERSNFENQGTWTALTAMLTYFPGEFRRYFMKQGKTGIGSYKLKKDAQGNQLYLDENGNESIEAVNKDGTNRLPIKQWTGDPREGLIISLFSVIGKTLSGKRKEITPYQMRNAALALYFILFKLLIGNLLLMLLIGDKKKSDQSKQEKLTSQLITKVSNDMSFYESVIKPVDEFGLAGTSFIKDLGGDLIYTLGEGNTDKIEKIMDNISLVKDLNLDN